MTTFARGPGVLGCLVDRKIRDMPFPGQRCDHRSAGGGRRRRIRQQELVTAGYRCQQQPPDHDPFVVNDSKQVPTPATQVFLWRRLFNSGAKGQQDDATRFHTRKCFSMSCPCKNLPTRDLRISTTTRLGWTVSRGRKCGGGHYWISDPIPARRWLTPSRWQCGNVCETLLPRNPFNAVRWKRNPDLARERRRNDACRSGSFASVTVTGEHCSCYMYRPGAVHRGSDRGTLACPTRNSLDRMAARNEPS